MLSQRSDDAMAMAPGSSWQVPHGCHKATQAIVSSFKKRRGGRSENVIQYFPHSFPAILLSTFQLPAIDLSLEAAVSPSDGFYHLSSTQDTTEG